MVCQRRIWQTDLWRTWRLQEICGSTSKYRGCAIGFHGDGGPFVDTDALRSCRPAVIDDPREEGDQPSHAIARDEMAVSDDPAHVGQDQEITVKHDAPAEGIVDGC